MLKSIKNKILQINEVTGIQIYLNYDDKISISAISVQHKKGDLKVSKQVTHLTDVNELPLNLNKSLPVALVLNGKGVLIKNIPDTEVSEKSLTMIFPNINLSEYYYEFTSLDSVSFISIIRKDKADNIINQLSEIGFKTISFKIGFGCIKYLLPSLIKQEIKSIDIQGYEIHFTSEEITGFKKISEGDDKNLNNIEYLINNQYINNRCLLPIGASLELLISNLNKDIKNVPAEIIYQKNEFKYLKLFQAAGISLLLSIFLMLIISSYYYSHFRSLNLKQQQIVSENYQKRELKNGKSDIIKNKTLFLEKSGWSNSGKASYYADRISSFLPVEITLTSLNIYPGKTINTNEEVFPNFQADLIQVSGICKNPISLNEFISSLKIIHGIKKAEINNYQYQKETASGIFSLDITIE